MSVSAWGYCPLEFSEVPFGCEVSGFHGPLTDCQIKIGIKSKFRICNLTLQRHLHSNKGFPSAKQLEAEINVSIQFYILDLAPTLIYQQEELSSA